MSTAQGSVLEFIVLSKMLFAASHEILLYCEFIFSERSLHGLASLLSSCMPIKTIIIVTRHVEPQ